MPSTSWPPPEDPHRAQPLQALGAPELAGQSVYTAAVLGILEETGPEVVALIQCDAQVQRIEYIQAGESFGRIEVHGRGGTRFQPAFDWIAESGCGAGPVGCAPAFDRSPLRSATGKAVPEPWVC